jgi:hypothetical protein
MRLTTRIRLEIALAPLTMDLLAFRELVWAGEAAVKAEVRYRLERRRRLTALEKKPE